MSPRPIPLSLSESLLEELKEHWGSDIATELSRRLTTGTSATLATARTRRISLRLDPEAVDAADRLAAEHSVSRAAILRAFLGEMIRDA